MLHVTVVLDGYHRVRSLRVSGHADDDGLCGTMSGCVLMLRSLIGGTPFHEEDGSYFVEVGASDRQALWLASGFVDAMKKLEPQFPELLRLRVVELTSE